MPETEPGTGSHPGSPASGRTRTFLRRPAPWWLRLGASVASGLVLAAAYPPYDLGLLALVALIPLLWAWHGAGPGRAGLFGFAAGVVFFGITLAWTSNVGLIAAIALTLAQAGYWALAGAIVGGLDRLGIRTPWISR